jgi:hypothetical protein
MIRINLLRDRKDSLQGLVSEPGGASSFVSGREAILAGLFLVLGGAILWFVLSDQTGSGPARQAVVSDSAGPPNPPSGRASVTPATVNTSSTASGTPPPLSAAAVSSPPPTATATDLPAVKPPIASTPNPSSAEAAPGTPRGSTLLAGKSPKAPAAAVHTDTPRAASTASGGAITMRDLRVLGQGNSLQIVVVTDQQPEYKMFRVDNPGRVVIDLPGVWQEIPRESREQELSNSVVKTVRVAQNRMEPPLVRLVLEVESFPELQVLPRPDGLLINVTGK